MFSLRGRAGIIILLALSMTVFWGPGQKSAALDMAPVSLTVSEAATGAELALSPGFDPAVFSYEVRLQKPEQIYFTARMPEDYFLTAESLRYTADENSHAISIQGNRTISLRFGNAWGLGPVYRINFILEESRPPPADKPEEQEDAQPAPSPNDAHPQPIPGGGNPFDEGEAIDLYLNSLEIETYTEKGSLEPVFHRGHTSYTLKPLAGDWLILRMGLAPGVQAIIVDGRTYAAAGSSMMQVVCLAKSRLEITLVGAKGETRTYALVFEESPRQELEKQPRLLSLTLNGGSIPLQPAFEEGRDFYLAAIPQNTGKITLSAQGEAGSQISINGIARNTLIIPEWNGQRYDIFITVSKEGQVGLYSLTLLAPELLQALQPHETRLISLRVTAGDQLLEALDYAVDEQTFHLPILGQTEHLKIMAAATQGAKIAAEGKTFYTQGSWDYAIPQGLTGDAAMSVEISAPDASFSRRYTVIFSRQQTVVKILLGSREIAVNDALSHMDAPAYNQGGRIMVPLRFVSQALGGEVLWDGSKRQVLINEGGRSFTLKVDQPLKGMDVPPEIQQGRVFVPLRYVSQELGAKVEWLPEEKVAVIIR